MAGTNASGKARFQPRFDDHFAHRAQRVAGTVEIGLGAVVFMVGQELRQVARTNQRIDRTVLAGQLADLLAGAGGDDAVVGADFRVVPGPRTAPRVDVRHQFVDRCVRTAQCRQNLRRFTVLAQRQVAAIAAWVGDGLVGFIQGLGDIQGFLSAQAKLLRTDLLQGAKVEGQGRHLAHAFGTQFHQPRRGGVEHGVGGRPAPVAG